MNHPIVSAVLVALLANFFMPASSNADIYESAGSGNWGDPATWNNTMAFGSDIYLILTGHTVDLLTSGGSNGSFSCDQVSMSSGATLNGQGSTLTVSSTFTNNSGATFNAGTSTIAFSNNASISGDGTNAFHNLTINGNLSIGRQASSTYSVTVTGTFTNNGTGFIQQVVNPSGTGLFSFGIGPSGTGYPQAEVNITTLGTLSFFQVQIVTTNHPSAETSNSTGRYWSISPTGGGYTLDLTVPDSVADPYLTRWNGASWDPAQRTSDNGGSVTLTGITALSDWTVNSGSAVVPVELSTFAVK